MNTQSIISGSEIQQFTKREIAQQLEFSIDRFYLTDFPLLIDINLQPYNIQSRGGVKKINGKWRPFINLALWRYTVEEILQYREYDFFPQSIGSIKGTYQPCISALVSHELSHAIQIYNSLVDGSEIEDFHGDDFQFHYEILRGNFANALMNT